MEESYSRLFFFEFSFESRRFTVQSLSVNHNFKRAVNIFLLFVFISFSSVTAKSFPVADTSTALNSGRISLARDSVFSFHSKRGFVPSLLHNFGEQATAPFHMNKKQAWTVGGALAITGALFFADEKIDGFFKPLKQKQRWIDYSSTHVTEFGGNYGIAFLGVFGCSSAILNDRKGFQTTLLATQAVITSGVWVRLGKLLASRERPSASYEDFQYDKWWGPFQQFNSSVAADRGVTCFDAFPSGHTATAFSIASVFAHQYPEKKMFPVFAYTLASIVGISRMTEHTHWASDVFAGACIGYLCGKQVVKHARDLEASSAHSARMKIKSQYFLSMSDNQPMLNCFFTF